MKNLKAPTRQIRQCSGYKEFRYVDREYVPQGDGTVARFFINSWDNAGWQFEALSDSFGFFPYKGEILLYDRSLVTEPLMQEELQLDLAPGQAVLKFKKLNLSGYIIVEKDNPERIIKYKIEP